MDAPKKLKTKVVSGISYSLCSTYLFYDLIAEGSISNLRSVKRKYKIDSVIIKHGIWGSPIVVLHTSEELSDLEEEFEKI